MRLARETVETVSYTDKRLLESRVQVNLHARFGEGALETQVKLCADALLYIKSCLMAFSGNSWLRSVC